MGQDTSHVALEINFLVTGKATLIKLFSQPAKNFPLFTFIIYLNNACNGHMIRYNRSGANL